MEPGLATDLHRVGLGPPCMVRGRKGCRQRVGGRSDPTRMIAASVRVSDFVFILAVFFSRLLEFLEPTFWGIRSDGIMKIF